MDNFLKVWTAIVKETELSQVMDGEYRGFVINFLINDFYHRETAFAAKIFAAEYIRTKNKEYLERAKMALNAIQKLIDSKPIEEGFDEPMFTPRGIIHRKGSIPATILMLESALEASKLINYNLIFNSKKLIDYLQQCYIGKGRFYHDTIDPRNKSHYTHVVNTTAMSYFFLESTKNLSASTVFYQNEIEKIKKAILVSMRSDGFCPYLEPQWFQKIVFSLSKLIPSTLIKIYNRLLVDSSIFFGDGVHHLINIYYLIKGKYYSEKQLTKIEKERLIKGWGFIKRNLKEYQKDHILFDFSWEPKPGCYRHCNFIDTTTYFYILDFLRYLKLYQIISNDQLKKYQNGLLNHIATNLMQDQDEKTPSINAYEGSEAIKEKIMPRPSETIFNKGALMTNTIIDIYGK